jgi:hypothetical protein
LLYSELVGEAILLGEILIGIDLEGDEPGDDSKCILMCSVRGGSCVCICIWVAGALGQKSVCSERVGFFQSPHVSVAWQVVRGRVDDVVVGKTGRRILDR